MYINFFHIQPSQATFRRVATELGKKKAREATETSRENGETVKPGQKIRKNWLDLFFLWIIQLDLYLSLENLEEFRRILNLTH